jgi:hypothetical protein
MKLLQSLAQKKTPALSPLTSNRIFLSLMIGNLPGRRLLITTIIIKQVTEAVEETDFGSADVGVGSVNPDIVDAVNKQVFLLY